MRASLDKAAQRSMCTRQIQIHQAVAVSYIYMDMYTYVDVQYVSYTHNAHMMYFDGKIQEQNVFSFFLHVLRLSIGLLSITAKLCVKPNTTKRRALRHCCLCLVEKGKII